MVATGKSVLSKPGDFSMLHESHGRTFCDHHSDPLRQKSPHHMAFSRHQRKKKPHDFSYGFFFITLEVMLCLCTPVLIQSDDCSWVVAEGRTFFRWSHFCDHGCVRVTGYMVAIRIMRIRCHFSHIIETISANRKLSGSGSSTVL